MPPFTDILAGLNGASTVVVAAATVVLAWREIARVREKRESAEAEIRALAHFLLGEMTFAFGPDIPAFSDPDTDEERKQQARYVLEHLESIDDYVLQMLKLAPNASDSFQKHVREAAGNLTSALGCFRRAVRGDLSATGEHDAFEDPSLRMATKALSIEGVHDRGRAFFSEALRHLELITGGTFQPSRFGD